MSEDSDSDLHVAYHTTSEAARQIVQQGTGSGVAISGSYKEDLVRNSNLDPTGAEFYPSNPSTSAYIDNRQRQFPYKQNGRGNRQYGSGRTFTQSKSNYLRPNGRSESNKLSKQPCSNSHTDEASLISSTNSNRYNGRNEHTKVTTDTYNYSVHEVTDNRYSRYSNYNKISDGFNEGSATSSRHNKGNSFGNYKENNYHRNSNHYSYRGAKKYNYNNRRRDSYESNNGNSYNRYGNNSRGDYETDTNRFDQYKRGNTNEDRNRDYQNQATDFEKVWEYTDKVTFEHGARPYDNNWRGTYRDCGEHHKSDTDSSKSWRKNSNRRDVPPKSTSSVNKLDAASQRERLEGMLKRRILECLVCCEKMKETDRVWSCSLCFNILHLRCLKAWANSSKIENGWRCPACQNVYNEVPKQYKCYCSKITDPKFTPGMIPHSCGGMCLKEGKTCDHKCTLQCHPGPCPDCNVMVERKCGCGATKQTVKCNSTIQIVCDSVCNKVLACQVHMCRAQCHPGECEPCSEIITQKCYCGKFTRQVPCRAEYINKNYSCEEICNKLLSCENHACQKLCHEGPCSVCETDVDLTATCPCGKCPLDEKRNSCLDPIPCCGKVCAKILSCGPPDRRHTCQEECHVGKCPPCPLSTTIRCRCGHMNKEITCQELAKNSVVTCERKCTKKRSCGKHKCNQYCCIEVDHVCPLPCNRLLTCARHKCENTCHSGRCLPCMETSFEELFCECGASVLYPPIACGTKPPVCNKPCSRPRECGHDVNHTCHTAPCPPCTVFVKRWCFGKHEQRAAIVCHQENFSCGIPCGKELACGRHKCIKLCHNGACPVPCKQPCTLPRLLCGHPCSAVCHEPPCPDIDCKAKVPITCMCGLQKSTKPCLEVAEEFRNIQMAHLKEKMGALSKEQTVDLSDIGNIKKPSVLKLMECTEECRVLERNRRLAIGLQIRNPDLGQKLMPRYSDFLKQWAKKEPGFCHRVHDKLTDLVELAKQSKQKSRSYSFESMNRDKRHVIHELAEHFGVETKAYDAEPNRNVVATAIKDKSWLPSMSLLQVLQRESGQRKVPGPISTLSKLPPASEPISLKLSNHLQRSVSEINSNQAL